MDQEPTPERLSQISTIWADLFAAHGGPPTEIGMARERLLVRYTPAVYGYLLGATRDRGAADELFQEFALRLIRGDFQRWTRDAAGSATSCGRR
jgi:RNA polymerase sigma-70 factor (ECF subfamily)